MKINLSLRALASPLSPEGRAIARSNGAEFHLASIFAMHSDDRYDETSTGSNEAIVFACLTKHVRPIIFRFLAFDSIVITIRFRTSDGNAIASVSNAAIVSIDIIRGKVPIVKITKRHEF